MRASCDARVQNNTAAEHAVAQVARSGGNGSAGSKLRVDTSPPGSGAYSIGNMS